MEKLHFWCVSSDFDYSKAVEIKLTGGRFFDRSYSNDSTAYLINDVAAGIMKNHDPVGSSITFEGHKGTIIGVFRDFHAVDLAGPYVPVVMKIDKDFKPAMLVKYSSGSYPEVIGRLKEIYSHYEPEVPFKATLFRDLTPYSDLSLPSRIVAIAFVTALLLACLGLFGLASFTAENRTKEIGIRKANGATTISVMALLLGTYAKWLVLSMVISLPAAFIFAKAFLGRFHFHAPVPVWAFAAGPVIAITVALLTVSSQTWRVADRNPVKSLKYE
jgi:putative ABC transport system permease protein